MATTYFQRSTAASNVGSPPTPVLTSRQASTTAGGASADIATGNIAAGSTTNIYFFTDDPAPGADGVTGDYAVALRFSSGNAQILASVALARVNSSGAQQGSETALSTEVASNTTSQLHEFTGVDLGTWAAGDRLRVRVQLRNQHSMNQSCTLAVNNGADTIDTPFGAEPPTGGGTMRRWTGSAFVAGGTLNRWTGSAFATGGTLRRWTGSAWEPPP